MNTVRNVRHSLFPDRTCGLITLLLTATVLIAASRAAGILQLDTGTALSVYAALALTGAGAAALKYILSTRKATNGARQCPPITKRPSTR